MNSIVKNIIISILVGLLAYLLFGLFSGSGLSVPSDSHQIMALTTYVLAVFIGCTVSSSLGSGNGSGNPGSTRPRASTTAAGSTSASSSSDNSLSKEAGTVKWFNIKKGYGFITRDQGDDIFVHYRNIEGSGRKAVAEGQRVKFLVIDGDKGLQADEVEAL